MAEDPYKDWLKAKANYLASLENNEENKKKYGTIVILPTGVGYAARWPPSPEPPPRNSAATPDAYSSPSGPIRRSSLFSMIVDW